MKKYYILSNYFSTLVVTCAMILVLLGCQPLAQESAIQTGVEEYIPEQSYPAPELDRNSSNDHETGLDANGYPAPAHVVVETQALISHDVNSSPLIQVPDVPYCGFTFIESDHTTSLLEPTIKLSNPRVVKTNDRAIFVGGWLPDNQTLLVMEDQSQSNQLISTVNVTNNIVNDYAHRQNFQGNIIWLDQLQEVVYIDSFNATNNGELKRSNGDPSSTTILNSDISSPFIAANKSNNNVVALVDRNNGSNESVAIQVDNASDEPLITPPVLIDADRKAQFDWSNNGKQLVQYSYSSGQLRIIDIEHQSDCQIDLSTYRQGQWGIGRVGYALWSPDSQYLGFVIFGEDRPIGELAILDYSSGEIFIIDYFTTKDGSPLAFSFNDFAWAPTSETIIAEGHRNSAEFVYIDVNQKAGVRLMPEYTYTASVRSLAWSNDGKLLAYLCPKQEQGQICVLDVNEN